MSKNWIKREIFDKKSSLMKRLIINIEKNESSIKTVLLIVLFAANGLLDSALSISKYSDLKDIKEDNKEIIVKQEQTNSDAEKISLENQKKNATAPTLFCGFYAVLAAGSLLVSGGLTSVHLKNRQKVRE